MVAPPQELARSFATLQAPREPTSPKANPLRSTSVPVNAKLVEGFVAAWEEVENKNNQLVSRGIVKLGVCSLSLEELYLGCLVKMEFLNPNPGNDRGGRGSPRWRDPSSDPV